MKKIKPIYLYIAGILIAGIVFYFISENSSPTTSSSSKIPGNQMPQDQIHRGLLNNSPQPPGKDNVMAEVIQKMDELKKDVEAHPSDTLKIRQYADFLAEAHQKDQALVYYQKILNINPKRIDILFTVAYINYTNKNFDAAEQNLNKILAVDKNNVNAYYNLGAIAVSQGNKTKAEQIWNKLASDFPQSPLAQKAKESVKQIQK
ncbi:MAG: tetratricopeptide repeat protein [Ignavibacteriaceae bacterium]